MSIVHAHLSLYESWSRSLPKRGNSQEGCLTYKISQILKRGVEEPSVSAPRGRGADVAEPEPRKEGRHPLLLSVMKKVTSGGSSWISTGASTSFCWARPKCRATRTPPPLASGVHGWEEEPRWIPYFQKMWSFTNIRTTRWSSRVSFVWIFERYVTTFALHKALKSIA